MDLFSDDMRRNPYPAFDLLRAGSPVDVSGVRPAAPGLRDELPRVLQEPLTPGLHIHARPRPPET